LVPQSCFYPKSLKAVLETDCWVVANSDQKWVAVDFAPTVKRDS